MFKLYEELNHDLVQQSTCIGQDNLKVKLTPKHIGNKLIVQYNGELMMEKIIGNLNTIEFETKSDSFGYKNILLMAEMRAIENADYIYYNSNTCHICNTVR